MLLKLVYINEIVFFFFVLGKYIRVLEDKNYTLWKFLVHSA